MQKIFAISAGVLLALAATQAEARGSGLSAPLPDAKLAELRGGFDLGNGTSVTLGVTTDTRVDGREVLRTVFDIQDGRSSLAVAAGRADGTLSPVTVDRDGRGVATADGVVRIRSTASGASVDLASDALDVSHLVGRAFGSVIANSGNDRTIDVATTIDIGLSGVRPDAVGGSMARVDGLALDATTRLVR